MDEIWRPVRDFESFYEVSNLGRVRSPNGIRKDRPDKDGYRIVTLRLSGVEKTAKIHRLVADAFIGECPDGFEPNHKDLNRANNTAENLEYLTKSQNQRHAWERGSRDRSLYASRGGAVLKDWQVILIRRLRGEHAAPTSLLTAQFNVSKAAIDKIIRRATWAHI